MRILYNIAMLDVFSDALMLPDTVYILAPGANADVDLIPFDACILAVNAAVNIRYADFWIVADRHGPRTDWWPEPPPFGTICIFGFEHAWQDYNFDQNPALGGTAGPAPMQGILRCNGTVVAQAIQLCHWKGVTNCILNGCDMYGDHYYDGSQPYSGRKVWRYIDHINPLVDWIHRNSEMRVTSQTKTELTLG